jgi:hypothetical protein
LLHTCSSSGLQVPLAGAGGGGGGGCAAAMERAPARARSTAMSLEGAIFGNTTVP